MNTLIAAAVAAFIIMGGRKIELSTAPRGLRNNNPGNIKETRPDYWEGQAGSDGTFAIFAAPEFGIRAMARVLLNYQRLHGINSVAGIIQRWAPASENKTGAYIAHVAQVLGLRPEMPFDVETKLPELVKVIIKHENGQQPYSDELIQRGLAMAKEPIVYA